LIDVRKVMSWANRAAEAFKKAGYSVEVRLPLDILMGYVGIEPEEYRDIDWNSFAVTKKIETNDSKIPDSAGDLFKYSNDPVILKAKLIGLPEESIPYVIESGGIFCISPDGTIDIENATGEALKIVLDAGYKFKASGSGGGGSAGNVSNDELKRTAQSK